MSNDLILHGFETSNNFKVRIALGYKGLGYEFRAIHPEQRDAIVALSGQHLTPVLEHGDTVLFDSAAILRYLDAQFRDTPRLFGNSGTEQWEIEDHELFARTQLAGPMMRVIHNRIKGTPLFDEATAACDRDFAIAVQQLADSLGPSQWLVGETMTAADITAGAVMHRVRNAEILSMPAAGAMLTDWEQRVMAFDGPGRREA